MGVLFRQVLLSLIVSVKTGLYYDSLGAIAFFWLRITFCVFVLLVICLCFFSFFCGLLFFFVSCC